MNILDGKVAVVTGASSGIGLATALRFAEEGANVIAADLKGEGLKNHHGRIEFIKTDVSVEEDVKQLMQHVKKKHGRLDVLFNNAGVVTEAPLTDTTTDQMLKNFKVNTLGVVYGMKHGAEIMSDNGSIINTASTAGTKGVSQMTAYGASKWAVVGVTKTASIELGNKGVRVNCICPSSVNTPQLANQPNGDVERMVVTKGSQLGRISEPEDLANVVTFLASNQSTMISGQAIYVDGGASAGNSLAVSQMLTGGLNKAN